MKPPVKYEDLVEEWRKDAPVNITEPAMETAKIPPLHAKYLHILSYHKKLVKKYEKDYKERKLFKTLYYKGEFNNPEDLEKYNLEPFKKNAGVDMATYIEADTELNEILLRQEHHQEIVDFCTKVVAELNQRTWQMGNIIKWQMFTRP